jgi:hypothetical protein
MVMRIIRPEWSREIHMKTWSLGDQYSMILITGPARDKGIAYLKRGNEIWNWQPGIDRVIKLPPSMMSQSWMGSDFTNDDLVQESSLVKDYNHELKSDTTIADLQAYRIDLIPKEDAAVVWGKVEMSISKEHYLELLTRFYDEDLFLINTMYGKNIQTMDGRTIPALMVVVPEEEPGKRTELEYKKIDFGIDINSDFFSLQNMKTLRP